jgi:hypothetical protein
MKMRGCFLVLVLCMACSHSASPLARLEADAPVISGKVVVQSCNIDGTDQTTSMGTTTVERGQEIDISGTLLPGDWGISGISPYWVTRDDESEAPNWVTRQHGDRFMSLSLHIHGEKSASNLGVIQTQLVELRHLKKPKTGCEFRVRFNAPRQAGTYVLDLQAIDESVGPKRGEPRTKPVGFPFWRSILEVR